MQNLIKKPSFSYLYVLKFPKYITVWRLYYVKDGFYHFLTSRGNVVGKMNLARFQYFMRHYLIKVLTYKELGLEPISSKIKPDECIIVKIEKSKAFLSQKYTKKELDALYDSIEDIEF